MARRMKEREITPDLLYSSPAKRALKTCREFAKVLGVKESAIKTDQELYHAGDDTLLSKVRQLNDKHDSVMLFGHNPGLTEFADLLTGEHLINIPTAGVVAISFRSGSWKTVVEGSGNLEFFDFPKRNTGS